jgi:hypothetical protein
VFELYSEQCAEFGIGGVVGFVLYSEHCAELGIGGVVGLVLYSEHCAEFQVQPNMNISNVALLLAASSVTDGTAIEYNKHVSVLLTVGAT